VKKPGLLCLLLLPACSSSYRLGSSDYELTWRCLSPEGCEHAEEVIRIDRARIHGFDFYFESTQDASFTEEALVLSEDSLAEECFWVDDLSFFGHELGPSLTCYNPAGFEIRLSIPNTEDPATNSEWFVSAWELSLL
jgi:hypothetical protein